MLLTKISGHEEYKKVKNLLKNSHGNDENNQPFLEKFQCRLVAGNRREKEEGEMKHQRI